MEEIKYIEGPELERNEPATKLAINHAPSEVGGSQERGFQAGQQAEFGGVRTGTFIY